MLSYALRIRRLECLEVLEIDESVSIFITHRLRGEPLLPLLDSLSYPFTGTLPLFVSPRLRSVNINAYEGGAFITLPMLLDQTPLLEKFSTDATQLTPHGVTFAILAQFSRLYYLSLDNCNMMDEHALKLIFSLDHLTQLRLLFGNSSTRISQSNPITPHLPSLRVLVISGETPLISYIFGCLAHTPLVSLHVKYYSGHIVGIESWRGRIAQIAQWSTSLSHLEISEDRPNSRERVTETSLLDPLLEMGGIQTLSLVMPIICQFSDAHFKRLAMAWPKIKKFRLTTPFVDTKPPATFATLEAFATHCPKLCDLSLHLSTSSLPSVLRASSRKLERLRIGYAVTNDPYLLARRLDALFPCLKSLQGDDRAVPKSGEDGTDSDGIYIWCGERPNWRQVFHILKTCQAVREDYRRSLMASSQRT